MYETGTSLLLRNRLPYPNTEYTIETIPAPPKLCRSIDPTHKQAADLFRPAPSEKVSIYGVTVHSTWFNSSSVSILFWCRRFLCQDILLGLFGTNGSGEKRKGGLEAKCCFCGLWILLSGRGTIWHLREIVWSNVSQCRSICCQAHPRKAQGFQGNLQRWSSGMCCR